MPLHFQIHPGASSFVPIPKRTSHAKFELKQIISYAGTFHLKFRFHAIFGSILHVVTHLRNLVEFVFQTINLHF